jgi:hypothetical protein
MSPDKNHRVLGGEVDGVVEVDFLTTNSGGTWRWGCSDSHRHRVRVDVADKCATMKGISHFDAYRVVGHSGRQLVSIF